MTKRTIASFSPTGRMSIEGELIQVPEELQGTGGRNLAFGTASEKTSTTTSVRLRYDTNLELLKGMVGQEVTISFEAKIASTEAFTVYIIALPTTYAVSSLRVEGGEVEWKEFSVTGVVREDVLDMNIAQFTLATTTQGSIRKLKIERGNKKTAWSPAPEDLGCELPYWVQNFSNPLSFSESGELGLSGELVEIPEELKRTGGRNLVINSGDEIVVNSSSSELIRLSMPEPRGIIDRHCTISFDARTDNGTDNLYISIHKEDGNTAKRIVDVKATTTYKRYSYSFIYDTNIEPVGLMFVNRRANWSGNTGILYLKNVKLEMGDTSTDWSPAPEDLDINWLPNDIENFDSPVQMSEGGLSVSEFSEYPDVVQDGLVLWYDFKGITNEDRNKETAEDLSGNGNDGSLLNFSYNESSGYLNGLNFDGENDIILVPASESLSSSESLTFEILYTLEEIHQGYSKNIIKQSSSSDSNYNLYNFGEYNGNGGGGNVALYSTTGGRWGTISGSTKLKLGETVLLTISFESSLGGQLYKNGVPIGSRMGNGPLATNNSNLQIALPKSRLKFLRIYNKALSEKEVLHNYAIEKDRWSLE